MKVDEITFNQSAINKTVIDMFIYIALMEHYINVDDYNHLCLSSVSVWKDTKKQNKDYTMLEISDFILDAIEEWREGK